MKIVITHKDMDNELVNSLRYFIESGKGMTHKIVFYDYTYYYCSKRVQIRTFQLFYWEIKDLKQHFSIYN